MHIYIAARSKNNSFRGLVRDQSQVLTANADYYR